MKSYMTKEKIDGSELLTITLLSVYNCDGIVQICVVIVVVWSKTE